jgi:hypothetical protein
VAVTTLRVADAWVEIVKHPFYYLVRRWNWKSAVTSDSARRHLFLH